MTSQTTTAERIAIMDGPGQWYGVEYPHGASVRVRRTDQGAYRLTAAWRVRAIHSEDPESVMCGCPLRGRSHVHAERDYAALTEVTAAYEQAREDVRHLRVVSFARAERVGA